MPTLIQLLALIVPALGGGIFAGLVGHGQVRALRQKTGDKSALTTVLSGEFLQRHHEDRKAA
jgi:hypothetical protein